MDVTKKILLCLLLVRVGICYGQDESYKKEKLSKTDLTYLMSYYTQEGNNSAVTGGEGNEALKVYSNKLLIAHKIDSFNSYSINTHVDVISSASTDTIDFDVSSASRKDIHAVLTLGYSRNMRNSPGEWGVTGRLSVESDYFSHGIGLWYGKESADKTSYLSIDFKYFLDDLRWGRKVHRPFSPKFLIYPVELRGTNWFDRHIRHSYNLSVAYRKDINRRTNIAVFPYFALQHGLLSTPFHRVVFNDGDVRVENLPIQKFKHALGLQLNKTLGDRIVVRNYFRWYNDSFGVSSQTASLNGSLKLSPVFTPKLFYRIYRQSASKYWQSFGAHDPEADFYISDYDLSGFYSHKVGLGFKYYPLIRSFFFHKLSARYSYYYRTDGLKAHILSTVFDL